MPSEHACHLKMIDDQFTAIPLRSLSEICLHLSARHSTFMFRVWPVKTQVPFISNSTYLIRELFPASAKSLAVCVYDSADRRSDSTVTVLYILNTWRTLVMRDTRQHDFGSLRILNGSTFDWHCDEHRELMPGFSNFESKSKCALLEFYIKTRGPTCHLNISGRSPVICVG